jgi:hypothetical protein
MKIDFDDQLKDYQLRLSNLEKDPSEENLQMAKFSSALLRVKTVDAAGRLGFLGHWRRSRLSKTYEHAKKISDELINNGVRDSEYFIEAVDKHWNETIKLAILCAKNDIIYNPGIDVDEAIERQVA